MISATAVVQIAGRPKEHVEKVLEEVSKKVDEHGYRTQRIELTEVEPLEGEDDVYSGFFEVDLELKNHEQLFGFIQDFNPASIEVSDPDEFEMSLADYNALVTTVASTIQQYDQILKEKIAENQGLKKRSDLLTQNLVMLSISKAPKRISVISTETGIAEQTLEPVLSALLKHGAIRLEGELYSKA
jgi:DNA-binding Lrp family transcriptional regulator